MSSVLWHSWALDKIEQILLQQPKLFPNDTFEDPA